MLPVQQPRQLVRFEWTGGFNGSASSFGGGMENYFSYPMYKDLRDKNQAFSGILAADKTDVGVSWNNQAQNEDAEIVTGNYFELLGLKPAMGRLLNQQDDTAKNAKPAGRPQLRLLEIALCRVSGSYWPNPQHQRPSLHHRRCRPRKLPNRDRRLQTQPLHPHEHVRHRHPLEDSCRRLQQSPGHLAHAHRTA